MRIELAEVQGKGRYDLAHANTNLSNILMLTYTTNIHTNAYLDEVGVIRGTGEG